MFKVTFTWNILRSTQRPRHHQMMHPQQQQVTTREAAGMPLHPATGGLGMWLAPLWGWEEIPLGMHISQSNK